MKPYLFQLVLGCIKSYDAELGLILHRIWRWTCRNYCRNATRPEPNKKGIFSKPQNAGRYGRIQGNFPEPLTSALYKKKLLLLLLLLLYRRGSLRSSWKLAHLHYTLRAINAPKLDSKLLRFEKLWSKQAEPSLILHQKIRTFVSALSRLYRRIFRFSLLFRVECAPISP